MNTRPRDTRRGSNPLLLALALAAASCAGGSSSSGTGGSGQGGTTATGGSTGTGGSTTGTGGTSSTGGTTGTGGTVVGTGGTTGTGGGSSTGGTTGTGGNPATGGTTGTGGSGGAKATGGTTGTGGASATGGVTGTGGAAGAGGSGGCPSDATFCSGFETPGLPAGAVYMVNASPGDWSRDFAIDTTQHHAGNSSLLVKKAGSSGTSGSSYVMLAVPVPSSGPFWARFYIQSDTMMGGTNPHNGFAGPSDSTSPNGVLDAFAEDVGIAFNTMDPDVTWPTGYGRLSGGGTNPYTLPAMTWKCIELSYDISTRHQQLYIDGTLLMDKTNYPPSSSYPASTFATFKFGFDGFNGPARQMWYDDVVVAPSRIGC